MKAQLFINANVDQKIAYRNVDVFFTATCEETNASYVVRYGNDDFEGVHCIAPKYKIRNQMMNVFDTEISDNDKALAEIHEACSEAFYYHFDGVITLMPIDGYSIELCSQYAKEGTLSPRQESFINNSHYLSMVCDESTTDGTNAYLVSVTPYNTTPDSFDYDVVERTPFIEHRWFSDEKEAIAAYKSLCVKYITM